jgi:hypothetical protein
VPTFINGLPFHVLVVHAVVVLVPLAVLGTVVIALWPTARRRYGWLTVGLALLATIAIPIATNSGENLRDRLPRTSLIHTHAELGDQLLILVAPLLLATVGLMVMDHYRSHLAQIDGGPTRRLLLWTRAGGLALTGLIVVFAVLSGVQVVRIGDSGAQAAWSDTQYTAPSAAARHGSWGYPRKVDRRNYLAPYRKS